jgi:lipopolysaccharide export system protein LptA
MNARRRRTALLALALLMAGATPAAAQSLPGQTLPGKPGEPVTIDATKGIEWHQAEKIYVARGNAKVTRGDLTVEADVLTAHYRGEPGKGGGAKGGGVPSPTGALTQAGSSVWKVTAAGHVRIVQKDKTVTGGHGVYNLDTGVFLLTGGHLKMVTASETITAEKKIEYRSREKKAIVEGHAVAIKDNKRITAERFTAYFGTGPGGNLQIERVVAEGGVEVRTPTEVARARRALYNHQTGIAELIGGVKLTRGDNQLNGHRAEINLKTGVSRLLASEEGTGRVRGLFIPNGATGGQATPGGGIPGLPSPAAGAAKGKTPSGKPAKDKTGAKQ